VSRSRERSRVTLAFCADEPTGNLDSQTARGVMGLIEDLHRQGGTIVLVTHDPQIAARALMGGAL
jgi:ABC-type lipoprotein export system ATPase subunit